MKTIIITAPSSGSGKTTITVGLIRALKNRGLDIAAFKTGPDYIDTAFLGSAAGRRAGNLDKHLQGSEGIFRALSLEKSEYAIIEGAMGYFDGVYNTYENSSYDISKNLGIHAVLIYTPKGEMFTAIPKIIGMAEFQASSIKAVIFNNIEEEQYLLFKEAMEKHTTLKVLGYIPKMEEFELKSRHLGLVQSMEIDDIDNKIEFMSEVIEAHIDIDGFIELMRDIENIQQEKQEKRTIKIGIALDKAFSFYYRENLHLLESICKVIYFSPLQDESIPECDLLYIGGGYPEIFKEELSLNRSMLRSIKAFGEKGGFIYAECGGFMYLNKEIDGFTMVDLFHGKSTLTKSLKRFGYIDINVRKDCLIGKKGDRITAHEFHKSVTSINGESVFEITKTMGDKKWFCGYQYKNVFGGYPHINFLGNDRVLKTIFECIEKECYKWDEHIARG